MINKHILREFELERELEKWLVTFDPQDNVKIVWNQVLDCCRMPLDHEFNMRLRLDDRFNPSASLC
jgi:hypothetical protein